MSSKKSLVSSLGSVLSLKDFTTQYSALLYCPLVVSLKGILYSRLPFFTVRIQKSGLILCIAQTSANDVL